jgi:glycosyltransferase involved in cell wall biosynthesis
VPRVTVIIPTYNRPDLLSQALATVLMQSFSDFEVLVWNDGGEDVRDRVPELDDPRVRYHLTAGNQGQARAVADAIRTCGTEYLAQLDDDDEWRPGFLQVLVSGLDENPEAGLAFCDHWIIDADGAVNEAATDANSIQWGRAALRQGLHRPAYELVLDGSVPSSATVLRKSAIDGGDFPPQLTYAQDLWLAYLATREGRGAVFEPERLGAKRRHAGQGGSAIAPERNLRDLTVIYGRMLDDPGFDADSARLARLASDAWANYAVTQIDRPRDARQGARRGFQIRRTLRSGLALAIVYMPNRSGTHLVGIAQRTLGAWRRRFRPLEMGGGR